MSFTTTQMAAETFIRLDGTKTIATASAFYQGDPSGYTCTTTYEAEDDSCKYSTDASGVGLFSVSYPGTGGIITINMDSATTENIGVWTCTITPKTMAGSPGLTELTDKALILTVNIVDPCEDPQIVTAATSVVNIAIYRNEFPAATIDVSTLFTQAPAPTTPSCDLAFTAVLATEDGF
jgi:hypothetical protein